MKIEKFKELPIIGILRGIKGKDIIPLADCIINSGLKTIEITMNTQSAGELIRKMIDYSSGKLIIGAGTVLTLNDLEIALHAGASFIVMPNVNAEIITYCKNNNIPVFPGALTPNEIFKAWHLGASMVKVFPSSVFGPKYFNEIKGPFNKIELMACGGVSDKNIREYFFNGASGVAFGASIFNSDWISNNYFDKISFELKKIITAFKNLDMN